ncbi:MAG: LacI family transcriptional regulator [Fimbriimonadaceae bacterium]|nr:LacI family transcriptional regulator [Fimbriimonadaceae bacterium]
MRRPVRIKDIAAAVGVSEAAVSGVLNRSRSGTRVSDQTRQRIIDTARAMNYVPHAGARALAGSGSRTLGVLMPKVPLEGSRLSFGFELVQGVMDAAEESGRHVILFSGQLLEPEADLTPLAERRCDGLIVLGLTADSPLADWLAERSIPAVVVGHQGAGPSVQSLMLDNRAGIEAILRHLQERGHRKIVMPGAETRYLDGRERTTAFLDLGRELGLDVEVLAGAADFESTQENICRWFARVPSADRATAFVCFNDAAALGAACALRQAGLRIPQDAAVTGFDDIPPASFADPPLTTVVYPFHEMGRLAGEMLSELIQDRPVPEFARPIPRLCVRRST